jgi:hypothetical protein
MISMKTHLTAKVAKGSGKSSDSIAIKKIFLNANEFQRGISEKWIQIDRQMVHSLCVSLRLGGRWRSKMQLTAKVAKGSAKGSGKSSDSIAIKKIFLNANEFQRGIDEKCNQIDH